MGGHEAASSQASLEELRVTLVVKSGGRADRARVWLLSGDGSPSSLYLDHTGVVEEVESWALASYRCAGTAGWRRALRAFVASGLVKSGRTHTIHVVVPAVLAKTLRNAPQGHPWKGMVVLRLNGLELTRQEGSTALLVDLLETVMEWAERTKVRVKDAAWEHAQKVLAEGRGGSGQLSRPRAGRAVVELLTSFEQPVLVLLDELQGLLQPTMGGELDVDGVNYIRDNVLRRILIESPPTMLWAVTGSSMALTWIALASMPVNGQAPLRYIWPVHLPAVFPEELMLELVDDTVQQLGLQRQDVQRLLEWSGGSPALFATLVEDWNCAGRPADQDAFAADFVRGKMQEEVAKEWCLSLAHMTAAQRIHFLGLTSPMLGAQLDRNVIHKGLFEFLEPYMEKNASGAYYLKNPSQRQFLRNIIGPGGELRTDWSGLESRLTPTELDLGFQLLQLGDVADKVLGLRKAGKDSPDTLEGIDQLGDVLQDLADRAEERLPPGGSVADRWEAERTFTKALHSPSNAGAFAHYSAGGKQQLTSHRDFLVYFLRLIRNVLAHPKPWYGFGPVDVEVVLALPRLVGMTATELSEALSCVSALAPATMQAAAAADAAGGGAGHGDNGSSGDETRTHGSAAPASAASGRGSSAVSGLVSWPSSPRTTALSSGVRAGLSMAGRTPLGRPGPSRMVLPAPARIRSGMRVAAVKQPRFLFA